MLNRSKLRLNVTDLCVESFDPAAGGAEATGTVLGRDGTTTNTATGDGIEGCDCQTAFNTCYGSCPASCHNTCAGWPGCDYPDTEAPTCDYTCYWRGTQPFIDSVC